MHMHQCADVSRRLFSASPLPSQVKHVKSVDGFAAMYDSLYSNAAYLHWS